MSRPIKALAVLLFIAGLVFAGYTLYGKTDWAVASNPPVNPTVAWGKCLSGKPSTLQNAKPGIDPGSHLYYTPVVIDSPSGERQHVGWVFYGSFRDGDGNVDFRCETDIYAKSAQWASPE